MEMLDAGFCEIDGVDPAEKKARQSQSPQKETIQTNINPKGAIGGGGGSKPGSQQKKIRGKAEDQKCQFCGRGDKAFTS